MSSNCTSSGSSSSNHTNNSNTLAAPGGSQGTMTLATTKFLKLNQSHFTQGMDFLPTPSPSESSDYYQPHHHPIPYHLVTPHHQYYPHASAGHQQYATSTTSPMQQKNRHHYGTVSSGMGRNGKSYGHHMYQSIGPSTISSKLRDDEHHYAKPDNMGNIEIIKSKHARTYDEMNNEI